MYTGANCCSRQVCEFLCIRKFRREVPTHFTRLSVAPFLCTSNIQLTFINLLWTMA